MVKNESFVITAGAAPSGNLQFMNQTTKITTVDLNDSELPIIRNIDILAHHGCGGLLPTILFGRNSAVLDEDEKPQIDGLLETMKDNPTIVLEIGGRANSDEQNPDSLSNLRTQTVFDLLIKSGANPERLTTVSYSDTVYYVAKWGDYEFGYQDTLSREYIRLLTDKKAIEKARELNSSIRFTILRNDYVPKHD